MAHDRRLAARNNYMLRMEKGKACFKRSIRQWNGDRNRARQQSANDSVSGDEVFSGRSSSGIRGSRLGLQQKEQIVGKATSSNVDKSGDGELGLKICGSMGTATAYVTDVPVTNQSLADVMARSNSTGSRGSFFAVQRV